MEKIIVTSYKSPVGELILGSFDNQICICDWAENKHRQTNERKIGRNLNTGFEEGSSEIIDSVKKELVDYFLGKLQKISAPIFFSGTEFQCRVWTELMKLPYGTTTTYGELAGRIGKPKAVRAVASAVAANPISILVPCHRVIGSDGRLTGYAGGLSAKKALLSLENIQIDD